MKENLIFFSGIFVILLITLNCGSLLPSIKETPKARWKSFDEAKNTFEKIIPYQTKTEELHQLGFDPFLTPNLKISTYLDIIQLFMFNPFMFNPSIKKEELDDGIQACIDAKTKCTAYEIGLKNVSRARHGSVFLDLFNFKRRTKETGWEFKALIVIVDNIVVYKLWGGKPIIDESREVKNPLGPLQNPSDLLIDTTIK
ncbi:MAG: hypothetical protein AB1638_10095 [Nitrospirota bacterium]